MYPFRSSWPSPSPVRVAVLGHRVDTQGDVLHSDLEGIPPDSCYPLSFLQSFFWMTLTFYADFRKQTFETLQTSLAELHKAADPVLQLAFPDEQQGGGPIAHLEYLKAAPERLKAQVKDAATISAVQALATVKSHYPRLDLQRVGEGFANDADEDKIDALLEEIKTTSDLLVENLDL